MLFGIVVVLLLGTVVVLICREFEKSNSKVNSSNSWKRNIKRWPAAGQPIYYFILLIFSTGTFLSPFEVEVAASTSSFRQ